MVRKKGLSHQEPNLGKKEEKEEVKLEKDKSMYAAISHLVMSITCI